MDAFHSSANQFKVVTEKSNYLLLMLDQYPEHCPHRRVEQLVDRIPLGAQLPGIPRDDFCNLRFADLQ